MRITKSNYNDLRTQELDNNFAKVWHVNELVTQVEQSSLPYKTYIANMYWKSSLHGSPGNDTPVVSEIYNNTGNTITWHDTSASTFSIGGFDNIDPDRIMVTANFWGDDNQFVQTYYFYVDNGSLIISVTDATGTPVTIVGDGASFKAYVEIKIF